VCKASALPICAHQADRSHSEKYDISCVFQAEIQLKLRNIKSTNRRIYQD